MGTDISMLLNFNRGWKKGDKAGGDYLLMDGICALCVIWGWFELRSLGLKPAG
jgi:hypothetical protein